MYMTQKKRKKKEKIKKQTSKRTLLFDENSINYLTWIFFFIKQKWKTEAIEKCDVMVYTKIFLKFPCKFWPCSPEKEFFIYAHERRGYYTFWQVSFISKLVIIAHKCQSPSSIIIVSSGNRLLIIANVSICPESQA